ncbi:hypothetical protein CK203_079594 [Vitis vinifera]|uniref:Uncharacterized protein n=1 Tax=Vitis vinifera TaxID=29760 RepID=A0A438EWG1_VITVI|nr:hypothetical protein CK203_079594 [Vitis vinifera]
MSLLNFALMLKDVGSALFLFPILYDFGLLFSGLRNFSARSIQCESCEINWYGIQARLVGNHKYAVWVDGRLQQVDGDGRLVPATDDEVMEVEDLLEEFKIEMPFVADTGQTVECTSKEEFPSGNPHLECSEASLFLIQA